MSNEIAVQQLKSARQVNHSAQGGSQHDSALMRHSDQLPFFTIHFLGDADMAHAIPMLEVLPSTSIDCDDGRTPELAAAYKDPIDNANGPNGVFLLNEDGDAVGPWLPRSMTAADMNAVVLEPQELAVTSDTDEIRKGDMALTTGGISLSMNTGYVYTVHARGTPTENGVALVAAYTKAKSLTPGGSAKDATNRAKLRIMAGKYLLTASSGALVLDTAFVDIIGEGVEDVNLQVDGDYNIQVNADNITISGIGVTYISTGTAQLGAIHINAGAGGSFDATNAGLRFIDISITGTAGWTATSLNSSITTLAIFAQRVISNVAGLFAAVNKASFGTTVALTCSGKFWDCVCGIQVGSTAGGAFGGACNSTATPNIFTGELRNCRVLNAHLGLVNRGIFRKCEIRQNQPSKPAVYAGQAGKFYYCWLYQATAASFSIGFFEEADVSVDHCTLRANGIDISDHSGSNITNLIASPNNTTDDNYPSTV